MRRNQWKIGGLIVGTSVGDLQHFHSRLNAVVVVVVGVDVVAVVVVWIHLLGEVIVGSVRLNEATRGGGGVGP